MDYDRCRRRSRLLKILSHRAQDTTVVVTGNIGRDVLPMLLLKEQLSQYDYVGHFHTKNLKKQIFGQVNLGAKN